MKKNKKNGNSILLVLIISTALGVAVYSTIDLVGTESRLNKSAYVYHEARLAAEALLQTSFADLNQRFETSVAFPIDELAPSNRPLEVPSEYLSKHSSSDSHLVHPTVTRYTSASQFNSQPTEVIGGRIPPGEWRFIDPRVPGNELDPLAGTRAFVRGIEILSKATVSKPRWGESTAYSRQVLEVRDAPLFAHAIFYNLPMEIAPGADMDIYGSVHSNGDSYFQTNTNLRFHQRVTSAGEFFHGRRPGSGQSNSHGNVTFKNRDGQNVAMNQSGHWVSSKDSNWESRANQLWDGNVQSSAHDIMPQNPVGVAEYREDTNPHTSYREAFNGAYPMIQPVLNQNALTLPDPNNDPAAYQTAVRRNEMEKQKFAYQAGLTISVTESGQVSYSTFQRDAKGDIVYAGNGEPTRIPIVPVDAPVSVKPFHSTTNKGVVTVQSGLHDKRQARDLNIVEVNMDSLRNVIHRNDPGDWADGGQPSDWWNGIVYVEFPQKNGATRPDGVNPAVDNWGVKLVNGQRIPNPNFARDRGVYGTTIATNQMMYVHGHYNADGNSSTGSPTAPDSNNQYARQNQEAPAALAADSVTFLSTNWSDSKSAQAMSNRTASSFTEVSAAVLAGLVPSGKTGSNSYSGGVENFPRFLENWSGKTFQLRGSIVALFESEVGIGSWGKSDVYNAPNRAWGFHDKLGEGFYPPGTPSRRTYRGKSYEDMNEQEYITAVTRVKNDLGS